jgi:hypothetical protein
MRGALGDLGGLRERPGGVWVLHADDKVQRNPLFGLAPLAVSRHGRARVQARAGVWARGRDGTSASERVSILQAAAPFRRRRKPILRWSKSTSTPTRSPPRSCRAPPPRVRSLFRPTSGPDRAHIRARLRTHLEGSVLPRAHE